MIIVLIRIKGKNIVVRLEIGILYIIKCVLFIKI